MASSRAVAAGRGLAQRLPSHTICAACRQHARQLSLLHTGSRPRTPAVAPPARTRRRSFLTLPDFSKLSPFGTTSAQALPKVGEGESRRSYTRKDGTNVFRETTTLPYDAAFLCSIVADVESYSTFLPYCLSSEVLSADAASSFSSSRRKLSRGNATNSEQDADADMDTHPTGEPTSSVRARLTVGYGAFNESYVSDVDIRDGEWVRAQALSDNPIFQHLSTLWLFESLPSSAASADPSTRLTFTLAYAFANPLYAAVASSVFERMAPRMVEAFQAQAKQKAIRTRPEKAR